MKKGLKKIVVLMAITCMSVSMNTNLWTVNAITSQSKRNADTNLALNKTATASDVEAGTSFTADKAVDGNSGTRWASGPDHNSSKAAKWLQIDFGQTTIFDTVDISWEQQNILKFELQVSDDASSWSTVYSRTTAPTSKFDSVVLNTPAIGRYLRIYVTNYNGTWPSVSIYEASVYNSKNDTPDESEGNYKVYPTPQKVTDTEERISLTDEINIIKEDGIDEVTKDRIDEVFEEHGYVTHYSDLRNDDMTNFYIGVNGSGEEADTYHDVPRDVFVEADNKYDMHVVDIVENGDIVILGRDSDAAYYGLATLEQMLDQSEDQQMKVSTIEDFAFQKYRGAVEGYYGYPWTVEGTLSWMDYAKRYKMNIFLYGPKSDPYHLGKWDEDYPMEVTDEEYTNGIRTQDQMRQYAEKATESNVDFVWVAHPAMQKPIDFTNETTIEEGIQRLMTKFDHMYQLGVREFGIFVDDISDAMASATCDMQIYMLNQVQNRLYDKYNTEGAKAEDMVKPLFFTPAWYTTGSGGASANLPKFKNVHPDIEICFTGNNVFSSISNASATTFKNWIGRTPVMWWNYPVNDAEDSVFFTNPINFDYSQDPNPTNIKGVLSNPMNFSEASKVAFFGIADYTWNPQQFDAKENWNDSFDGIIPDDIEMADALRVVYGNLNDDYIPTDVQRILSGYNASNKDTAKSIKNKMYEIMNAVEKIETLKDSDNPVYRLLLEEAQTSINKLYDMATVIGGAMAVVSSDDPVEQVHGYYIAQAANERLNIIRNERYKMVSLEGAGEDIYNSILQARPSEKGLKPFVPTAMNAIQNVDPSTFDTSGVDIQELFVQPNENVEAKQGSRTSFIANVRADRDLVNDVIWSVEGATGVETTISMNGVLRVDNNELSPYITVKAISAYDRSINAQAEVKITDRKYEDPTIPVNLAVNSKILGASGKASAGEGPENVFDDSDTTKWCPGNNSNNNQWVAFDLGAIKQISKWQTVGGGVENPLYVPLNYSLQVLKDPNPSEDNLASASYLGDSANWNIVAEYKNNKENITYYNFDTPMEGRYLRLFIGSATQPGAPYPATRIFESRVFGVDKDTVERTHDLTVDPSIENGILEVDAQHYEEGAKVNIGIHPAEGYQLQAGSLKFNENIINGSYFIMPSEDVTLSAVFEPMHQEDTSFVKGILKNAIDKANMADSTGQLNKLAPKVKAKILHARDEAVRVYENEQATNAVCLQAWLNLADALHYLDFKADKELLLSLITSCADINRELYTEESLQVLDEALANAQSIYDNADVLQATIDEAYQTLETAKLSLVEKGDIDKTALKQMLDMITNTVGNGDAYKKDVNWDIFEDALQKANDVMKDQNAVQAQVYDAMLTLASAYENIRLLPDEDQLTKLSYFISRVKQMNRALYTNAELESVDALSDDVSKMLSDFDSKLFAVLDLRMNDILQLMDGKTDTKQPQELPAVEEMKENTVADEAITLGTTQPKTGVNDPTASLFTTMIVSIGAIILLRKRKS